MSISFTQSQIDSAVSYLMHGGPGGGELSPEQYQYTALRNISDLTLGTNQATTSYLSDFILQLQLAINQGHSGIAASKNLCRDSFGVLNDAIFAFQRLRRNRDSNRIICIRRPKSSAAARSCWKGANPSSAVGRCYFGLIPLRRPRRVARV
jgi:hypothetical protein